MKYIFFIFIGFVILHICISYFLPSFIQVSPFPYDNLLRKYFSFYPYTSFANFDGYQYISIAKMGYNQLQQSYFPLFPIMIAVVAFIVLKNYILAGTLVSVVTFLLGLFYFRKYTILLLKD